MGLDDGAEVDDLALLLVAWRKQTGQLQQQRFPVHFIGSLKSDNQSGMEPCIASFVGCIYGKRAGDAGGILSHAPKEGANIANCVSTISSELTSGSLSMSTLAPVCSSSLGWSRNVWLCCLRTDLQIACL